MLALIIAIAAAAGALLFALYTAQRVLSEDQGDETMRGIADLDPGRRRRLPASRVHLPRRLRRRRLRRARGLHRLRRRSIKLR